jgi:hypothetical protein
LLANGGTQIPHDETPIYSFNGLSERACTGANEV